jgi:hypothetical protein
MELDKIITPPTTVTEDALHRVPAKFLHARTSRVDANVIIQPQVPNAVVSLAPTGIKVDTARTSYAMRAGNPDMSR